MERNGSIIGRISPFPPPPDMLDGKTFLGVITARGGSKGVPGKNIVPLAGRPLISYTVEAAKQSTLLDRCIVSTDSEEIAKIARDLGMEVPFMRPAELATDAALALDVLAHAIRTLEAEGQTYDYILMLQPTSPLRTGEDIDACIAMAVEKNADSVFAMKQIPDFAPEKLKTLDEDGRILPLFREEKGQSAPRHKGPGAYKRNGAVYLTRTKLILAGDQFGTDSYAYVMPLERSIDINGPEDIVLAEFLMQRP